MRLGVQYAARPLGGGVVVATESECGTVGAVHKPMRSRWRSTAAIAAAVTASTICFKEGGEAASEPCTVLDVAESCMVLGIGAREGRPCVTRGLNILGGNDGVSLSGSAAWNITGDTYRRSRSVLRGCGAESLSEPEKVARLEFFWGEAVAEVVVEGMVLLEARRGARGEKARKEAVRTAEGRWSATCVVTRGAGAELL